MQVAVKLTQYEAQMIDKALYYMTLDEEISKGQYRCSWLSINRRINKKLRDAGAEIEKCEEEEA